METIRKWLKDICDLFKGDKSVTPFEKAYKLLENLAIETKSKTDGEVKTTGEKYSTKGLTEGKITLEMSDTERVKILNKKSVNVVSFNAEKTETLKNIDFNTLQKTFAKNARPVIRKVAEAFGIFDKVYHNADIEVEFEYSKGSLRESIHNQKTVYGDFVKMLSVFPDVIRNAVGVETHKDKYKGTRREDFDLKQTYVLASALKDESGIIPVKLEVKEFDKKTNKLYLSVVLTKKESRYLSGDPWQSQTYTTTPTSIISIADLVSIVNPQEGDFLKYFPDSMLDSEQLKGKQEALEKDAKKREGLKGGKNSAKGDILNTILENKKLKSENERLRREFEKTAFTVPDGNSIKNYAKEIKRGNKKGEDILSFLVLHIFCDVSCDINSAG